MTWETASKAGKLGQEDMLTVKNKGGRDWSEGSREHLTRMTS